MNDTAHLIQCKNDECHKRVCRENRAEPKVYQADREVVRPQINRRERRALGMRDGAFTKSLP